MPNHGGTFASSSSTCRVQTKRFINNFAEKRERKKLLQKYQQQFQIFISSFFPKTIKNYFENKICQFPEKVFRKINLLVDGSKLYLLLFNFFQPFAPNSDNWSKVDGPSTTGEDETRGLKNEICEG